MTETRGLNFEAYAISEFRKSHFHFPGLGLRIYSANETF